MGEHIGSPLQLATTNSVGLQHVLQNIISLNPTRILITAYLLYHIYKFYVAPVAQRIEQWTSNPKAARSNRARRTFYLLTYAQKKGTQMLDLLIKDGLVAGLNKVSRLTNIGIKRDKIEFIGETTPEAEKTINAKGLYVCPGFIDMHAHDDFALMRGKPVLAKVRQGITTVVVGQCGISPSPMGKKHNEFIQNYTSIFGKITISGKISWRQYTKALADSPLTTNVIPFTGHGNIRTAVIGSENRAPDNKEMHQMENILQNILEQGCRGMSTGLIYPPGIFASTKEITSLAKILSKFGSVYSSHVRGEGKTVLPAIQEALDIAKKTDVSVEISHIKTAGKENWHKTKSIIQLIDKSRREGLNINYDQYPYTGACTTATALLPPWMHEGGMKCMIERLADKETRKRAARDILTGLPGWENFFQSVGADNIIIGQTARFKNRIWEGISFRDAAHKNSKEVTDFLFDLLLEERGATSMIMFAMSEESIKEFMKQSYGFIGTDGILGRHSHPRAFGTFPKILRKYVREEKLLSIEQMVQKTSTGPAEKLGLKDRGRIEKDKIADIVIFNPNTVCDHANYQYPNRKPSGIPWVIVNGKIVIGNNSFTGTTPGRVL